MPPSSRGLGHGPFKAATGIRIPLGALQVVGDTFRRARGNHALPKGKRERKLASVNVPKRQGADPSQHWPNRYGLGVPLWVESER